MFVVCYNLFDCTQITISLPSFIQTIDEACNFIKSDNEYSIGYYGFAFVSSAEVYEVNSYKRINVQRDELRRIESEKELLLYYGFQISLTYEELKNIRNKIRSSPPHVDIREELSDIDWIENRFFDASFASEEMLLNSNEMKVLKKYNIHHKIIKFKGQRPYSYC